MMRLASSTYLGDAGKQRILFSFTQSELAELPDSAMAERICNTIKRIGFTGSKDHFISEAGLFFPQEALPEDSEVTFLIATGVRWMFGAPGLACADIGGLVRYVVGVFVGAVTKSNCHSVLMDGS